MQRTERLSIDPSAHRTEGRQEFCGDAGLIKTPRQADGLSWPDGVSYSLDGHMYVSAAQIARADLFNDGEAKNAPPYLIYRFAPETPGRIGH